MDQETPKSAEKYIEVMEQHKKLQKAQEFLNKLLLELSVRADNEHVGTGMGGNHAQWWFLVNHSVKMGVTAGIDVSFYRVGSDEILIYVPEDPKMKQARLALNDFYDAHPDKFDLTLEQLTNQSFIKDAKIRTRDAKIYLKAIETGQELVTWLDPKIELNDHINKVFAKEYEFFEKNFLQEMKLPLNYFEDHEERNDPVREMFEEHPVWGAKNKVTEARQKLMADQLLSREDLDKLIFIGSCPQHITLFALRVCLGIERIVRLNIDELPECNFLNKINKAVDG